MEHLILLLETYKYFILLPLAILEGPILAVIAGFLTTLGVLNLFIVFFIVTLGDVIGDTLMYVLGRFGGKPIIKKIGPFFGVTDQKLEEAKVYFTDRHTKAVVLSKLVYGIGTVGLITAGLLKMPYRRFMTTCLFISIGQTLLMLALGIIFGHAYVLLSKYLDYYAAGVSIVAIGTIIVFVFIKIKKKVV